MSIGLRRPRNSNCGNCRNGGKPGAAAAAFPSRAAATVEEAEDETNPLLEDWTAPFGVPPFARIKPEHFMPAFTQAFASHASEVADIAGNPEAIFIVVQMLRQSARRLCSEVTMPLGLPVEPEVSLRSRAFDGTVARSDTTGGRA